MKHILVVDDDATVLRAFVAALPEFRLTIARDANEALAAASKIGRLDLIITDYLMPTIAGDELIARVRERHPRIKALIVTGHGDILDQEAPDWWMSEPHLTKPFDATTLKHAVTSLIGAG